LLASFHNFPFSLLFAVCVSSNVE